MGTIELAHDLKSKHKEQISLSQVQSNCSAYETNIFNEISLGSAETRMSSWNKDIQNIRGSILMFKENILKAQPRDRLDYISKIIECIQFMKQSNIGWTSLLTNPQMVNGLDEEALKDIFVKFQKASVERIDSDVDCIDRYMINLVPRDVDADSWT